MAAPAVVGGIGKLGFFNTVPAHATYQKIGTTLINVTIYDNLTGLQVEVRALKAGTEVGAVGDRSDPMDLKIAWRGRKLQMDAA
ncbi:hypothetical protein AVEN_34191-1 [Araneus ventricosus]|uniref:Uncharacterized protein n=1 Tax=Araneus ventricosus TaxID=182803 RepID=A0A4Y2UJW8_ARAVE|nr:hypothetical protein AVEN_34191-1 [Araneus ventricosus]